MAAAYLKDLAEILIKGSCQINRAHPMPLACNGTAMQMLKPCLIAGGSRQECAKHALPRHFTAPTFLP